LYFYNKIKLNDTFETRVYLIFLHFSLILIIFKIKKIKFPQNEYDNLFYCIENNLRELGFGDIAVNKKMKSLNNIFYDILIKINKSKTTFKINKNLMIKYFTEFDDKNLDKYELFQRYFEKFFNFCFDINPQNMIKDALKFKVN
jgi:hypothetical protein